MFIVWFYVIGGFVYALAWLFSTIRGLYILYRSGINTTTDKDAADRVMKESYQIMGSLSYPDRGKRVHVVRMVYSVIEWVIWPLGLFGAFYRWGKLELAMLAYLKYERDHESN